MLCGLPAEAGTQMEALQPHWVTWFLYVKWASQLFCSPVLLSIYFAKRPFCWPLLRWDSTHLCTGKLLAADHKWDGLHLESTHSCLTFQDRWWVEVHQMPSGAAFCFWWMGYLIFSKKPHFFFLCRDMLRGYYLFTGDSKQCFPPRHPFTGFGSVLFFICQ